MGWRDTLVAHLEISMQVTPVRTPGAFTVSLTWSKHRIDLPAACNQLARHFKVPSVTVVRRSPPASDVYTATLRIAGANHVAIQMLQQEFSKHPRDLALAIVSSGT